MSNSNTPKPTPPAKSAAPAAQPAPAEKPKADESVITTRDTVDAMTGRDADATEKKTEPAKKERRRVIVSQGAFEDLIRLRKITDAGTGYTLRVGYDGTVTAYDRATGQPAEDVDVVCPPVPDAPDADERA